MDKTPDDIIRHNQSGNAGVLRIGLKEWEALSPLRREILRQLFIARKEDD